MVRHVPKASIPRVAAFVVAAIVAFGGSCKAPEEGAVAAPLSGAASGSAPSLRAAIDAGARRAHAPAAVARDALRLLSEVVDLDRRPAPGDRLRLLFASKARRSGAPAPRLLAAEFDAGGVAAKFFYYRGSYYDERGESALRALLRKPIVGGDLRSSFGWIRHPILGHPALHGGTSWRAPAGTPVRAAARGTVETAGPERHGGLSVLVRHSGGYETYYKHLSSLASGLGPGDVVGRGQIIGVVGSADLFYQIILDHRPIDPESRRCRPAFDCALPRWIGSNASKGDLNASWTGQRRRSILPAGAHASAASPLPLSNFAGNNHYAGHPSPKRPPHLDCRSATDRGPWRFRAGGRSRGAKRSARRPDCLHDGICPRLRA